MPAATWTRWLIPQTGVPRPLSTSYPAIATLPDVGSELQLGMRGKAKLYTGLAAPESPPVSLPDTDVPF